MSDLPSGPSPAYLRFLKCFVVLGFGALWVLKYEPSSLPTLIASLASAPVLPKVAPSHTRARGCAIGQVVQSAGLCNRPEQMKVPATRDSSQDNHLCPGEHPEVWDGIGLTQEEKHSLKVGM